MTWYGLVLQVPTSTTAMVQYGMTWCCTAHLLQATIQPNDGTQPIAPSSVFSSSDVFCFDMFSSNNKYKYKESYMGEFVVDGFFFLGVVTFFVTLRADLEDYFKCKT